MKLRRYYVAKCATIEALKTAFESKIWACSERQHFPQPKDFLTEAFKCSDEVGLLFSVNNQHGWHGFAVMTSPPGSVEASAKEEQGGTRWHRFSIEWKLAFIEEFGEQCLPFIKTDKLTVETNDGVIPVNKTRNYDEVSQTVGEEMCRLMEEHYGLLQMRKEERIALKIKSQTGPFFTPGAELNIEAVWKKLMSKVESLGRILLACPFGSQRYNLSLPESDTDMFIVYEAATRDILGFNPPQQTLKNRESETCDYTILEVHRYCELLLGGDPKCVETLFMDPSTIYHADPEWLELCKIRHAFLTRECMEKYTRDAQGSKGTKYLDKLLQHEQPNQKKILKVAYVVIRLLQNARDVAEQKELAVYRQPTSQEWHFLKRLRAGEVPMEEIQKEITRLQGAIKVNGKSLPSRDIEETKILLQDWLLKLRFANFKQYMESKIS